MSVLSHLVQVASRSTRARLIWWVQEEERFRRVVGVDHIQSIAVLDLHDHQSSMNLRQAFDRAEIARDRLRDTATTRMDGEAPGLSKHPPEAHPRNGEPPVRAIDRTAASLPGIASPIIFLPRVWSQRR